MLVWADRRGDRRTQIASLDSGTGESDGDENLAQGSGKLFLGFYFNLVVHVWLCTHHQFPQAIQIVSDDDLLVFRDLQFRNRQFPF